MHCVCWQSVGASAAAAETGGGDRFQQFLSANDAAAGAFTSGSLLINPIAAQRHLAAPSGGDVAMGGGGLDDLMDSSAGWYRLSYQIDRAPEGANHELDITAVCLECGTDFVQCFLDLLFHCVHLRIQYRYAVE